MVRKIINELAIDCDKFFDEVAFLNEQEIEQSLPDSKHTETGLNKRLFFNQLQKYGVDLSEQERALIC